MFVTNCLACPYHWRTLKPKAVYCAFAMPKRLVKLVADFRERVQPLEWCPLKGEEYGSTR